MSNIKDWLDSNQIEFVECIVPDFNGVGKGKVVPASELSGGVIRLPEAIFGQDVVGNWSEDHDLFDVADIDMLLVPDETTLVNQPWSNSGTAQCICDCRSRTGEELDIAPRTLLRKVLALFDELDMVPVVAQEAEFYLVARNLDPMYPLTPAHGVSGRQQKTARSFQMEAMSEYSPFIETLHRYTKAQNIRTAGMVQEMGRGQLEVNFVHGDPLEKADEMFNFKRAARQAAIENDCYATFLAKPITGEPGSSMHLHQSLVDKNTGKNLFVDEDGSYSERFMAYLGGLQKYSKSVMSIFAPNVNSYRRFEGAESCPTNVEWGLDNRTTGFRIPQSEPNATRIENRIPGSDTNPYLAIAANLACGYLGLQENLKPKEPVNDSAWDQPYTMPRTLIEALSGFIECEPLINIFGERFVKAFVDVKTSEAKAFAEEVTAWEREHLLLTV